MPKLNHWKKELLSNPVVIAGKRVPFQPLAGNRGVLQLDEEKPEDVELIAALNDLAERRKFGIVKITEAEYLEKKKLLITSLPSSKRKQDKLKVMQPLLKPKQSPAKAVPAVNLTPTNLNEPKDIPPNPVRTNAGDPLPPGASISVTTGAPTPAFVPRTAPKPDASEKPPAVAK